MGKKNLVFGVLLCGVIGTFALPYTAIAAENNAEAEELEKLLDDKGDEVEVETENEYALPVPAATEEDSPVLTDEKIGGTGPADTAEDLFLPLPSDQANIAPGEGENTEDFLPFTKSGEVQHEASEEGVRKPAYSLFLGPSMKDYPVTLVKDFKQGLEAGASFRAAGTTILGMPVSILAFGAVTFTTLNDVVDLSEDGTQTIKVNGVKDRTYRIGALLEWEWTRRIQVYAGITRYFTEFEEAKATIGTSDTVTTAGPTLGKLSEKRFSPGVGAEYDFYVIPHAHLGLRLWAEIRYVSLLAVFSLEPVPKRRNSLNFDWE